MQEIVDELRLIRGDLQAMMRPRRSLGFCPVPGISARTINVNSGQGGVWYFYDKQTDTATAPPNNAIECEILGTRIFQQSERKEKPIIKWALSVQADHPYELVIGITTMTAKSLLLGLAQADLRRPVTLSFRAGKEKTVFGDVWQDGVVCGEVGVSYSTISEADILNMLSELEARLGGSSPPPKTAPVVPPQNGLKPTPKTAQPIAPRPTPAPLPPPIAPDALTGQTQMFEEPAGGIVDQLSRMIQMMGAAQEGELLDKLNKQRDALGEDAYAILLARLKRKVRELNDRVPFDRAAAIALIPVEMERVGWSKKKASEYLGGRTRADLSDAELETFLAHLRSLPAVPALANSDF
jgi:hypothetical protein